MTMPLQYGVSRTHRLPFCDLVFILFSFILSLGVVVVVALAAYGVCTSKLKGFAVFLITMLFISLIASNILASLLPFRRKDDKELRKTIWTYPLLFKFIVDILFVGYFLRFIHLIRRSHSFGNDDLKRLVSELCLLRLLFSSLLSLPALIVQLFCAFLYHLSPNTLSNIVYPSTFHYSLPVILLTSTGWCCVDVCWSCASVNRNLFCKTNFDRFLLSWPNVLGQLFWRLGTIGSRAVALTLFASCYAYVVCLVIGLHWLVSAAWFVLLPFATGESAGLSVLRFLKLSWYGFMHTLDFWNFSSENFLLRLVPHYIIMTLENSLLIWLCLQYMSTLGGFRNAIFVLVWGGMAFGLAWMVIYYRFLNVRILMQAAQKSNDAGTSHPTQQRPPAVMMCNLTGILQSDPAQKRVKMPSRFQGANNSGTLSTLSDTLSPVDCPTGSPQSETEQSAATSFSTVTKSISFPVSNAIASCERSMPNNAYGLNFEATPTSMFFYNSTYAGDDSGTRDPPGSSPIPTSGQNPRTVKSTDGNLLSLKRGGFQRAMKPCGLNTVLERDSSNGSPFNGDVTETVF